MKQRRKQETNSPRQHHAAASSKQSFSRNEFVHHLRNHPKLVQLSQQDDMNNKQSISKITTQIPDLELPPSTSQTPSAAPSRPLSPVSTHHGTIYRSKSNESNRSRSSSCLPQSRPRHQQYELSKLPTPRLALLTGNRKLISRLGQMPLMDLMTDPEKNDMTPYCYLLKKPASLRELTIETAEDMAGHIVVCMHHKVSNIFKFIYSLRSPQLQHNEIQDIVFLCTSLPNSKTFELVSRFPKVYFMVVSVC